jgi:hypothetical protein
MAGEYASVSRSDWRIYTCCRSCNSAYDFTSAYGIYPSAPVSRAVSQLACESVVSEKWKRIEALLCLGRSLLSSSANETGRLRPLSAPDGCHSGHREYSSGCPASRCGCFPAPHAPRAGDAATRHTFELSAMKGPTVMVARWMEMSRQLCADSCGG